MQKTAQDVVKLISAKKKISKEEMSATMVDDQRQEHQKKMQQLRQLKSENYRRYLVARDRAFQYGDVLSMLGEVNLPIILKGYNWHTSTRF
jgi:hypothetical protein